MYLARLKLDIPKKPTDMTSKIANERCLIDLVEPYTIEKLPFPSNFLYLT